MNVISLSGARRVGKDTLANYIMGALLEDGLNARTLRFAGPLKQAARVLWDLTDEQVNGAGKDRVDPRWGITPRRILQHLGTEHGRLLCGDLHVRRLLIEIDKLRRAGQYHAVIVTDTRFPNELAALGGRGATTVYMQRPGADVPEDAHESERALLPLVGTGAFDVEVFNLDDDITYWAAAARDIVETL